MALSPDAAEWVDRAEADVRAVRKLDLAEDRVVMAFHTQQAVEKYLKAVLVNDRVAFPKSHDLLGLVEMCAAVDSQIGMHAPTIAALQPFAVSVRYPGPVPSEAVVRVAIVTMDEVRAVCRRKLGLPAN